MNNSRRTELAKIIEELDNLVDRLENIKEEEQEAFDNMPEGLQNGDRGQAAEAAISAMDEAMVYFDDIKQHLETASE